MTGVHLHKRFESRQVRDILAKYFDKQIKAKDAYRYLSISKSRFYQLLTMYRDNPEEFAIDYRRNISNNKLNARVKEHILSELTIEKEKIIDNPNVPTSRYNYSYIRDLLSQKYQEPVSLPTVITIAKDNNFYKPKRKKAKVHDRQVLTSFVGELVQHDSSHHLFAPDAFKKWYLITSVDDFSRKLLLARLVSLETAWTHILSVEDVCTRFGIPFSYYVDQQQHLSLC